MGLQRSVLSATPGLTRKANMADVAMLECVNEGDERLKCGGAIELRMALSGSEIPFPRCEIHWDERLDREDDLRRRYPVMAPSDFDPSYAGESWSEDDYY